MNIVLIGSGNVAFHLAKAFTQNNIKVEQIFARNEVLAHEISAETGIPFSVTEMAEADLYIIAVSDSAVAEVSKLIPRKNALVAHTSGSLPKEILEGDFRKASFYPLQTFSKTKVLNYAKIPLFIEAENPEDLDLLKNLASEISENVAESSYEKRKYIHLTAVFACNFSNHLYAQAKKIADTQDIPFEYFLPLINETAAKIHYLDPKTAQTGPAVRNDERIIELHRELITDKTQLEIYNLLNASIKEMYCKD